jgi:hypothetical protein
MESCGELCSNLFVILLGIALHFGFAQKFHQPCWHIPRRVDAKTNSSEFHVELSEACG